MAVGKCSRLFQRIWFNNVVHPSTTWGWPLSCTGITTHESMPRHRFLILVFSLCNVAQELVVLIVVPGDPFRQQRTINAEEACKHDFSIIYVWTSFLWPRRLRISSFHVDVCSGIKMLKPRLISGNNPLTLCDTHI